jgi:hypothetical protein
MRAHIWAPIYTNPQTMVLKSPGKNTVINCEVGRVPMCKTTKRDMLQVGDELTIRHFFTYVMWTTNNN